MTTPAPHPTMKKILAPALSLLALAACQVAPRASDAAAAAAAAPAPADTSSYPAWSKGAVVYEMNVRQLTPEGTLAAAERHLPRLDSLGVDILWLMPVQPIGVEGRKGGLGSYYAIADYRAVNPEFGTEADFRRFVETAHGLGMRVILDWVANHTARDHPWTREHRDWYTLRPDGSISFPRNEDGTETDWTDVADLDYGNPAMRSAMVEAMRWWVDSMNVDGFRADVAWGVPLDFWARARRELSAARPGLFLLAEAEGPQYHDAFHASYGWELHHLMNEVARGEKPASALDRYFARQDSLYGPGAYRMYFTSNHDENSWKGSELERMGANHLPAFVLSATAEGSLPLIYNGQEASLDRRLRFFDKDTIDWGGASLAPFYRALFDLKEREPALANGPWGAEQDALATDAPERVYAFTRGTGDDAVLVAVNFGDAPVRAAYTGLAEPGAYTDWFSRARVSLAADGVLEIPAHGYRVLVR